MRETEMGRLTDNERQKERGREREGRGGGLRKQTDG